jgi:zinc protease
MQSAVGQSDALKYETGAQKAQFIRRILEYNLPANYTEIQSRIIKNMTKQEMAAFAKKYINPEKMNILLVGDKQKIQDGVKKLGYDIVELDADGKPVDGKKAF